MSIAFAAGEDCFAGWLRAYLERHGLEAAEKAAVERFVEFARADLASDPAVGWAGGEEAAIRASGRRLRLGRPDSSPRTTAHRDAVAVGRGPASGASIAWGAAEPITGGPRPT